MHPILDHLTARLSWPVEHIHGQGGYFEVVTDPEVPRHVITWPAKDHPDPPRPEELAHELCHAWLAETVHPQFSGTCFARGTKPATLQRVSTTLRAATDWFVDHALFLVWPEGLVSQIKEHADMIRYQIRHAQHTDMRPGMAMVLAQEIKYQNGKEPIPKVLLELCNTFLRTEPQEPTERALRELTNRILACEQTPWKAKPGIHNTWKLVPAKRAI